MTNSQSPAKDTAYLLYLDAARGIAAWMVVIFHFIYWKYPDALPAKLSFFVFNGLDAVSFFFVLSGLVLSYKYLQSGAPMDLRSFFVNRFIRLFPAYFVTVLANFVYTHRHDLGLHSLQDMFLKNTGGFWEEAMLIRRHNTFFPPGWTMNMELSASLLLPFAIILFKTNRKLIPWLIFFCLLTGDSLVKIMFVHFLLGLQQFPM